MVDAVDDVFYDAPGAKDVVVAGREILKPGQNLFLPRMAVGLVLIWIHNEAKRQMLDTAKSMTALARGAEKFLLSRSCLIASVRIAAACGYGFDWFYTKLSGVLDSLFQVTFSMRYGDPIPSGAHFLGEREGLNILTAQKTRSCS